MTVNGTKIVFLLFGPIIANYFDLHLFLILFSHDVIKCLFSSLFIALLFFLLFDCGFFNGQLHSLILLLLLHFHLFIMHNLPCKRMQKAYEAADFDHEEAHEN